MQNPKTTPAPTASGASSGGSSEAPPPSWSRAELLADYRTGLESRYTDDIEERWKVNGRVKFNILGAGQEVAQVCAARQLRPGDWMRGYYRGMAEALATGTTSVRESLAQVLGNTEEGCDTASGGRMMGRHFGSRLLDAEGEPIDFRAQVNRASDVSSTASQMGAALGLGVASRVFRQVPELIEAHPKLSDGGPGVVHVSIGDASSAEGIALESIFQSVVQHAPVVFSVYDNGYGISVPVEEQVPHGSASRAFSGLAADEGVEDHGMKVLGPIEGWDYAACRRAYEEAYDWVRRTGQPALVHTLVTQPRGHSSSGDHRRYKDEERLAWEREFDCLARMRGWLIETGTATAEELDALEAEARAHVDAEAEAAWTDYYGPIVALGERLLSLLERVAAEHPGAAERCEQAAARVRTGARLKLEQGFLSRATLVELGRGVLVELRAHADASSASRGELQAFVEGLVAEGRERFSTHVFAAGSKSPCNAPLVPPSYADEPAQDTGAHILAAGVATLMAADPRVVTFGEDTGRIGGVTTCSLGLQSGRDQVLPGIWNKSPALQQYVPEPGFGQARVWDTAIAEATIVGVAAGLAVRGLRPIAEIQYHDYAIYGLQQMTEELACLRHRTDGGQEAPAIVWCQGHRLLGMWHSGSPMALFMTTPGLRVLVPRNSIQAVGMYRAVLQHGRDPAFVVVPLLDLYNKLDVPSNLDEVCIPLGQSEVLRAGEDATIVTYGHCCAIAAQAAARLAEHYGLSVEVVDLQTLNPLDLNDVARDSIRKTGRVLFFDEDYPNGAIGMASSELLHRRHTDDGHQLIYYVEAVRTLTAPEHKPGYGEDGGFFSKPQAHDVVVSVLELWNDSLPAGGTARSVY